VWRISNAADAFCACHTGEPVNADQFVYVERFVVFEFFFLLKLAVREVGYVRVGERA
jgi:hypothetical protein